MTQECFSNHPRITRPVSCFSCILSLQQGHPCPHFLGLRSFKLSVCVDSKTKKREPFFPSRCCRQAKACAKAELDISSWTSCCRGVLVKSGWKETPITVRGHAWEMTFTIRLGKTSASYSGGWWKRLGKGCGLGFFADTAAPMTWTQISKLCDKIWIEVYHQTDSVNYVFVGFFLSEIFHKVREVSFLLHLTKLCYNVGVHKSIWRQGNIWKKKTEMTRWPVNMPVENYLFLQRCYVEKTGITLQSTPNQPKHVKRMTGQKKASVVAFPTTNTFIKMSTIWW